MILYTNLTVENWLTIISLIFASIGGIFIFLQWNMSIKNRRAEFIYQILEKLRFENKLSSTMRIIDYEQEWYSKEFHNSNLEKYIDILFSYIDYICYLKATKNISKIEFDIFKYQIHRICISNSTSKYLWNLYHFSKKNNTTCSFQYLINYGIQCEFLSKEFKDNEELYTKTLNW